MTPWAASPSSSAPSGCCCSSPASTGKKLPLTWGQGDMTKPHLLHPLHLEQPDAGPLLAVLGALFGYFYTSRALLRQLETEPAGGARLPARLLLGPPLDADPAPPPRLRIAPRQKRAGSWPSGSGRDDLSSGSLTWWREPGWISDTISAQSSAWVRTLLMLGFTMLVVGAMVGSQLGIQLPPAASRCGR